MSHEDQSTNQHRTQHRYQICGRFFALNFSLKIKDAVGSNLYRIRSKPWSLHNELFFEDMDGR